MGILSGFLSPSIPKAGLGFQSLSSFDGYRIPAPSKSGQLVTNDSVMRHSAVYACVKVLSEDIAKLPLILYRRGPDDTREPATGSGLFRILHDTPNSWQTSFEWREMMMGHVLLRGNAYSEVIRASSEGATEVGVQQLIPRNPDRIQVFADDDEGVTRYVYTPAQGDPRLIMPQNMFHLRGLSNDGKIGMSVVGAMRESVGLSVAAETHGSRVFQNSAQVPIAIKHPDALKKETYERLKADFENVTGAENAGSVLFLEEGMTVEKIGMTNEDSQFLETRQFQLSDIARFFRIPPHKILDLTHATFTNIEHQSIEYVVDSLEPWCRRWESVISKTLIQQKKTFFAEFLLQSLMRGDMTTRSAFYTSAINAGWMSRNQVRRLENMNPEEGLDEFLLPMNMTEVGAEEEPPQPPPPPARVVETEEESEGAAALRPIIRAVCAKLVGQEVTQVTRYAKKFASNTQGWAEWLDNFYMRHAKRIAGMLLIDKSTASAYCQRQRIQVVENGVFVVQSWGDDLVSELEALVTSSEAKDE